MPYSTEHKAQSRDKILSSAIMLFARKGFDNVTLDELMIHAGLTRGAFYAHFKSKQHLYSEAIIAAANKSHIADDANTIHHPDPCSVLPTLIDNYLSKAHVESSDSPCPLAFLVTDVANREPIVRDTYTKVFKGLSSRIKSMAAHEEESQALATAALMIGGVAIARALDDDQTKEQLLSACRDMAKSLINN